MPGARTPDKFTRSNARDAPGKQLQKRWDPIIITQGFIILFFYLFLLKSTNFPPFLFETSLHIFFINFFFSIYFFLFLFLCFYSCIFSQNPFSSSPQSQDRTLSSIPRILLPSLIDRSLLQFISKIVASFSVSESLERIWKPRTHPSSSQTRRSLSGIAVVCLTNHVLLKPMVNLTKSLFLKVDSVC